MAMQLVRSRIFGYDAAKGLPQAQEKSDGRRKRKTDEN
jgi:hypothetical protein